MNGLQLYQEIASRRPHLAASMVLVTGESINELSEKRMKGIKAQFLYKPFSRAELLGTLSRLLASQG
jgi:DNA-binding NtrC family response regulator